MSTRRPGGIAGLPRLRASQVKIAVIGGAGVRAPLLVNGLTRSDLPIEEIGLFDIDQERLAVISSLAASFAPSVRSYADVRACVSGADFIFLSMRVGGVAARARDEAIAIEHDVVGQETVGPAALRWPFGTFRMRWSMRG